MGVCEELKSIEVELFKIAFCSMELVAHSVEVREHNSFIESALLDLFFQRDKGDLILFAAIFAETTADLS